MADVGGRLLLCDLDGTLVDGAAAFRSWSGDLAVRHGFDDGFVEWMVTLAEGGAWERRELFPLLRERLGIADALDDVAVRFMREYTSWFRCEPEVVKALVAVREAGHRIAIVTNGPETQLDKISAAGLDTVVDAVCVSSIEGVAKPDPRFLVVAAARAGASLDGAWMIGDSDADIGAAHAAGVDSVWLHHGRSWTVEDHAPTVVADAFVDGVAAFLRAASASPTGEPS